MIHLVLLLDFFFQCTIHTLFPVLFTLSLGQILPWVLLAPLLSAPRGSTLTLVSHSPRRVVLGPPLHPPCVTRFIFLRRCADGSTPLLETLRRLPLPSRQSPGMLCLIFLAHPRPPTAPRHPRVLAASPLTFVLGTPLEGTAPNPPSFQFYSSFIVLLKSPFLHEVLPLVPTANGLPLPDPGTVSSVFLFAPEPFVSVFHLQLDGRFPGEQDWARLTRFCVLPLAGSDVRASCVYDVTRSCWVNGDTGV